jgi:hypothetical protein
MSKENPDHYKRFNIEAIDVTEQFNFNLGNVIKYVWRAGYKDGESKLDDLTKAMWYLSREIRRGNHGED